MVEGNERREAIVEYLNKSRVPVSGAFLAAQFGVSRQVIVQDVALLRAGNRNILSTNKGYVLFKPLERELHYTEVIMVCHTTEQTYEEMKSIVEYGGRMLDVLVDHDLYGQIRVDLVINTLEDAHEFCQRMKTSHSTPLKVLTDDCHYHTIDAPSEKVLHLIREDLRSKGFLIG